MKAKVREFDGVIKTNFLGDEIPKANMHYTYIACITIDLLWKWKKKLSTSLFRRVQIQSKKKIQMSRFINAKLESDLDSDSESKSDTELKSESEVESDTE